ncbi:MAG: bifunctional aspartate kinase/homoserine dehydrogenase I, partial [Planctomycetota bacterium]|nr:bifunctional aspartate kinase/homoserine dehydrogenase I [Planctomycetota bacterium]
MKVYKFGGTSVADVVRMENAAEIIQKNIGGEPAIVVVSATAGTTDMLFEAVSEAQCGGDVAAYADRFGERHLEMAQKYGCETELKEVVKELKRDLSY